MSLGTVTIVIPTYKRPEKLRRAISSVLEQSYRDVVALVSDNASCDGTREMVQGLAAADPRVAYHCHEENIGMINNFNFAFGKVASPFFGVLSDDDYLLPDFVADAMQAFVQYPATRLSILNVRHVDESGRVLGDQLAGWPREGAYQPGESILLTVDGSHPIITGCLFRREIIGDLFLDAAMGCGVDVAVMMRTMAKHPFFLSKKIGAHFVRHQQAAGCNTARAVQDTFSYISRIEGYIDRDAAIPEPVKRILLERLRRKVDSVCFSLLLLTMGNDRTAFEEIASGLKGRHLSLFLLAAKTLTLAVQLPGGTGLVTWSVGAIKGVRDVVCQTRTS